jgi:hypothetical protein
VLFDQTALNWSTPLGSNVSTKPEGRYDHGMAYLDDRLYIFGGWGEAGKFDSRAMLVCHLLN